MFGLSEDQTQYILKTVIEPLEKQGYKVYCFGSRARGDFKQFSDLDLLIEGQKTRPSIGKIEEELVNGSFPFKVELVFWDDVAESYKAKIQREKTRFSV